MTKRLDVEVKGRFGSIKRFFENSDGLESVEYAVMTALTIASLIVALGAMVLAISGRLSDLTRVL